MQADFHWINVISHIFHFGWKKDAISLQLYNGDSSKPTTNSSQYSISKLYWWGRREEKKILSKTSDRFSNTECMLHLSCVISLLELCTYTLTHTLTPWSYAYSGIRLCMSVGKSLILWEFFRKKSEPNCSRNYSKWIKCLKLQANTLELMTLADVKCEIHFHHSQQIDFDYSNGSRVFLWTMISYTHFKILR